MRLISLGILLGSTLGLVAVAGCTSGGDDTDGEGGDTGSGGEDSGDGGGSGNTTGDGGTSGTGGGGGGDPDAVACLPVTVPLLMDFTYDAAADPPQSETEGAFGDYTTTFSGGTYTYPEALVSDVTGSNWHISGDVTEYAGFGLHHACTKIDASAYQGIRFTISGNSGGAAFALNVGTAANTITTEWMSENGNPPDSTANFGRCTPTTGQYDGTCSGFSKTITVTEDATVVEVLWSDLTGGMPDTTVDPAEITFIAWNFGWTETSGDLVVDIVVDDVGFIP